MTRRSEACHVDMEIKSEMTHNRHCLPLAKHYPSTKGNKKSGENSLYFSKTFEISLDANYVTANRLLCPLHRLRQYTQIKVHRMVDRGCWLYGLGPQALDYSLFLLNTMTVVYSPISKHPQPGITAVLLTVTYQCVEIHFIKCAVTFRR